MPSGNTRLEVSEEALDHRVVKAISFAAYALRHTTMRKHRRGRLHFVMPALNGMHGQSDSDLRPRKCPIQRAGDQVEDGAPCHAVHGDLTDVQVHAGRQISMRMRNQMLVIEELDKVATDLAFNMLDVDQTTTAPS